MSYIAGADVSTKAVDIVLVHEDTGELLSWRHCPLAPALVDGVRDDLAPSRSVRHALPPSWSWDEVTQLAIEDPFSNRLDTAKKLGRVIGAVAACLPASLPVTLVTPVQMRVWLGLTGRMNKEQLRAYAVSRGVPETYSQDAKDAFVVASALAARINHELRRAA